MSLMVNAEEKSWESAILYFYFFCLGRGRGRGGGDGVVLVGRTRLRLGFLLKKSFLPQPCFPSRAWITQEKKCLFFPTMAVLQMHKGF